MRISRTRRLAAIVAAACLVVTGGAAAIAHPSHGGHAKPAAAQAGKDKAAAAKSKAAERRGTRGRSQEARSRRDARFSATGRVVEVGADSVTVAVKGGTRALHRTTTTFGVADDARITRDDAPAALSELQAGDHVAMQGAKAVDGSYTATRINASSPEPEMDQTDTDEATAPDAP